MTEIIDQGKAGGFVLAGGRSLRMGRDKAVLLFEGTTLIERALAIVGEVVGEPSIVGRRPDLASYAPVIYDEPRGQSRSSGPLGGIEAALAASRRDLNVFLPVDTPLMPSRLLKWMLARALSSGAVATIPIVRGIPQPLVAVYSRRLLPGLTEAINTGRLKTIDAVIAASRVHGGADLFRLEMTVPFMVPAAGFLLKIHSSAWFQNLNTPDDFNYTGARPMSASVSRSGDAPEGPDVRLAQGLNSLVL